MTPTTELAEKLEAYATFLDNDRYDECMEVLETPRGRMLRQAADTLRKQAEELERCRTALSSVVALDDLLEKRRVRETPEVRQMEIEGGEVAQGSAVENFFALLDAIHHCGDLARSAYNEPKQNGGDGNA